MSRLIRSPAVSLVAAVQVVTQPEIRFVNPIVQEHLVSTLWADRLRFLAFLSLLVSDSPSRGATQPIYGVHADHRFRTTERKLLPSRNRKGLFTAPNLGD